MIRAVLKWLVGVVVVVGVIVGGGVMFLQPQLKKWQEGRVGSQAPEVRVQEARVGRLVRTVSAPGELEPLTDVQISSRISAQIISLPFREGEFVREGDIVVRLDDRDLKAALDSAEARVRTDEARLEGAEAGHRNAVAEWERISSLFDTNDVSRSQLDDALAAMDRAKSELEAARHSIDVSSAQAVQSRENLNFAIIRSPMDGVVTRLNAEVGEVVVTGTMNNAGTVVLEIADLSQMLVKAEVDESDVAPVREGQQSKVYLNAYPGEVFTATVKHVALKHSMAADRSKYYETELTLHLDEGRTLYSGLSANVEIEVEMLDGIVLVPSQAVRDKRVEDLRVELGSLEGVDTRKTFARIVYVLDGGKARARPVAIGLSDLSRTAIVSGVAEGDEIIVGPWTTLDKLRHDQFVRVFEETPAPAVVAGGDATVEAPAAETPTAVRADAEGSASP